jgi:acyl-lipid (7-3)-desaturase (Delta-4 desaturase)
MAPDGEKVRQRRVTSSKIQSSTFVGTENDPSTTTTPTTQKCIPLSQLKTNEMCIDGIIYNIEEFSTKHPGGNTFLTFGGNDVTTQYKMIHPYHTNKHLLKMGPPVGIVQDYYSELRIFSALLFYFATFFGVSSFIFYLFYFTLDYHMYFMLQQ